MKLFKLFLGFILIYLLWTKFSKIIDIGNVVIDKTHSMFVSTTDSAKTN